MITLSLSYLAGSWSWCCCVMIMFCISLYVGSSSVSRCSLNGSRYSSADPKRFETLLLCVWMNDGYDLTSQVKGFLLINILLYCSLAVTIENVIACTIVAVKINWSFFEVKSPLQLGSSILKIMLLMGFHDTWYELRSKVRAKVLMCSFFNNSDDPFL